LLIILQVKICSIEANTVALYFSASWCPPCRLFTPKLIQTYQELELQQQSKKSLLEVVFVSRDRDEESFDAYFAKMPWLAVPFSDSESIKRLMSRFKVNGIPNLVVLGAETGEIYTKEGVKFISEYGAGASPFTPARIGELEAQERADKASQTIHSILGTPTRDHLISSNGDRVPISELEGKHVALCFLARPMGEFTAKLAEVYEKLKEIGVRFEVVAVYFRCDESVFQESFASMPWLAIPHGDSMCEKLVRYFDLRALPTLVLVGPDGKTMNSNIADVVEEHGVDAWEGFPFDDEDKMEVLIRRSKAKAATQTLESLLVSGDLDYVVGKDGAKARMLVSNELLMGLTTSLINFVMFFFFWDDKRLKLRWLLQVPVADLVGKTVMLYFSAEWCAPCRAFLPTLVKEYGKMKERSGGDDLEIVFVSVDKDQSAYDEYFSGMPWLALPLEDERKQTLMNKFRIRAIPSLVAVGSSGATLTTDAQSHIVAHGADAFPFTEEVLEELGRKLDEEARAWPGKVMRHELHELHELALTRRDAAVTYTCDECEGLGSLWSYRCDRCDFDLHPKCALGKEEEEEEAEAGIEQLLQAAAYVCEGGVCRKA